MPMVELVAKRLLTRNPHIGLGVVDLIVLLWLFTNPYDNNRRQLSSMKNILKMTETIQSPTGRVNLTDEELTQVVLGSLKRLKEKQLIYIRSAGVHYIRATLTQKGIDLVESSLPSGVLRRVTEEFGDNP
ncbi:MAG: hypothetical protein GF309_02965 [Candidatus Lokiarchaeota archaeon]|nr:hypothetical protein [Candidatus Lokiarchaeota archaeon]